MPSDSTEKTAATMWFIAHVCCSFSLMLNFLLLCFAYCQSLWVKNLGTLKSHPDREGSVVWTCHLFQSSTFEGENLEISVFSFAEEGEHIRG